MPVQMGLRYPIVAAKVMVLVQTIQANVSSHSVDPSLRLYGKIGMRPLMVRLLLLLQFGFYRRTAGVSLDEQVET